MITQEKFFWRFWWGALVIKIIVAVWLPFANDEAYYWVWGHHPQLSYFDHPPMIGWIFSIGTLLESFGNAARVPGVLLGHATLFIWYRILRPHLDRTRLNMWIVVAALSPFLGAGALVMTPDVPLVFFWSLSLLILMRMVEKPSPLLYFALGASLGLGFCSKYPIVLFVPITLVWLAFSGTWRKVRWVYVPITIASGLLFCLPVLYWNATHDWVSFLFQMNHGLRSDTRDWTWPFEYSLAQIAILFPPVVGLALRKPRLPQLSVLAWFGWGPILFFLYTSTHAHVEANWPIAAHPALIALAVANAPDLKWLAATAYVWAATIALVIAQIASPWIPIEPEKLKTSEYTRFDCFLPEAASGKEIYFGSYQMAAAVSYKMRRQFYKVVELNRRDFYDFQPQSRPKSDTFWIGAETTQSIPEWMIRDGYREVSSRALTSDYKILEVTRRAQNTDR